MKTGAGRKFRLGRLLSGHEGRLGVGRHGCDRCNRSTWHTVCISWVRGMFSCELNQPRVTLSTAQDGPHRCEAWRIEGGE